ncbi:phage protein GP20 [Aurantimonas sp. 22II-16-19i]|nr:phage protein GP20 [Aurantimonas sp. 22II-16-19i]
MTSVLNIFDQDAFGVVELNEEVVQKIDYKPQLLGSLNLFRPIYSRSRFIAIAKKEGKLALIPTSQTGEPPEELNLKGSDVRPFKTKRLAEGSTIYAEELQGVLGMPMDMAVRDMQAEVVDRMADIQDDMELTWEHQRLGAIQGIVYDSDGTTVLENWYTNWDITQPTEINFALGTPGTNVRGKCKEVERGMKTAAKGVWTPSTEIHAIVGDTFYDDLISHPNVEKFYLQWAAAADLQTAGAAYGAFSFGNITWHNYRGTDDGTSISVGTDKAKFFPVNARGAFQVGWAPAEFEPYVNQRGKEKYGMILPDPSGRNAFRRVEMYSYPLFICTRPEMLYSARGR